MGVILAGVLVAVAVFVRWRRSGRTWGFFVIRGVVSVYVRLWHRLTVERLAALPARGPAVLVANHTCSADAAFLTACCDRPLSFLAAREYCNIPLLGRVFAYLDYVQVSRDGRDADGVRTSLRRLRDGRVLGVFPEGGLSNAGREPMRRGKGGAAYLALKAGVPVFPACIQGGPRSSHIGRSWLSFSRVRVVFGPAVDLAGYAGRPIDRKMIEEVTQLLVERIEELRCAERVKWLGAAGGRADDPS